MAIDAEAWRQVVADARRGDRAAADRLVRENAAWIRSVIFAVTGRADGVDDIAQQVWARAWEQLDTLEDPSRLRSWLYSIARNAALDANEAGRRQRQAQKELSEHAATPRETSPVLRLAADELRTHVLEAIRALPVIYREPFVLRHVEDWSYAEIAAVLGLPIDSVETRLVRARRLLREWLQGKVEL